MYDRELNMNLYASSKVLFSTSLLMNLFTPSSASFKEASFGTVCL